MSVAGACRVALLLLTCGTVGCATSNPTAEIRARAGFDLDCGALSMKISQLGPETVGVIGCGQRAVYHRQCDFADIGCKWIRDPGEKALVEARPRCPAPAAASTRPRRPALESKRPASEPEELPDDTDASQAEAEDAPAETDEPPAEGEQGEGDQDAESDEPAAESDAPDGD